MSKQSQADRLAKAIRTNSPADVAVRATDRPANAGEMIRTTLSVPAAMHLSLRQLALIARCPMNDVLLLAVADLLKEAGRPCEALACEHLRQKLFSQRSSTPDRRSSSLAESQSF